MGNGLDPASRSGPPRPHVLGRLFQAGDSRQNAARLRRGVFLILAVCGLLTLSRQVRHLSVPSVYLKDIKQEYLLARAVLDGENPYALQPALAERYLPAVTPYVLPHPVPHPPFVAVLATPLGLVSYETACAVWLGLELMLLLVVVWSIAVSHEHSRSPACVLAAFCILLLWPPVAAGLLYGQLSTALAALLIGCWLAFRGGRQRLAGLLLGVSVAVKLIPVAIAGYFLVKRQWRVVLWSVGTCAACWAIGILALGGDAVRTYLVDGLSSAAYYRGYEGNYSVVGAVYRVFAGNPSLAPLVDLEWAAGPLSTLAALAVLCVAAVAVARADDPDAEFSLALCAMLLASPLTWLHYFTVLVWPLWVLARRVHAAGWEPWHANQLLLVMVMLSAAPGLVAIPVVLFGRLLAADVTQGPLPGVAGLPFLALIVGPGLLFWMLVTELRRVRRSEG